MLDYNNTEDFEEPPGVLHLRDDLDLDLNVDFGLQ